MGVEKLVEILDSCMPEGDGDDPLGPETDFRDHRGWDSIATVMLISEISAEMGVDIDISELEQARTANDLFAIIRRTDHESNG